MKDSIMWKEAVAVGELKTRRAALHELLEGRFGERRAGMRSRQDGAGG